MTIAQATPILWLSVVSTLMAGSASAQSPGTPRVEIGILAGGATIFTEDDGGALAFGTYAFAGSVTVNASRFVGIEGRWVAISGSIEIWSLRGRPSKLGRRTCCHTARIS